MTKRTRIPTGITDLDRSLNGGVPTGSLLTISARPDSQAELLVYTMSKNLDTYYITTERSRDMIRDTYNRIQIDAGMPQIVEVDAESPLDSASTRIELIPEDSLAVVDTVNVIEQCGYDRYRRFLNQLKTHMVNTNGIAILYALEGHSIPKNRDVTLNISDMVFDLQTYIEGGEVINELAIPKFLGGTPIDATLQLELSNEVAIDTSRDIA